MAKQHPKALLVVVDRRARRVAMELGRRFTGTLGILDMAKRSNLLPRVRPELENLRRSGFHIDEALASAFLQQLGE